ncbi:MAG TPA: TolC family protein [Kiritimatiellia bacterium]|nr:TolC family protein [Kiritimatiellia bacterium]
MTHLLYRFSHHLRRTGLALLLAATPALAEPPPPLLLTLPDTLRLAAEQNLNVVLAAERNRESLSMVTISRANLLPEISAIASQVRQERSIAAFGLPEDGQVTIDDPIPFDIEYPGLSRDLIRRFNLPTQGQTSVPDPIPLNFDFADSTGAFNFFNAQVRISIPLIDLSNLDEYRAAKQNLSISETELALVREQAMNHAAALFYAVIVQRVQLHALTEKASLHADKLSEIRDLATTGNATPLDVRREELIYANANNEVSKVRKNLDLAQRELGRFLNLDPSLPLDIQGDLEPLDLPQNDPETLTERAFTQRLDYLRQKQSEQAALFRRDAARKDRYPTLSATGSFGYQGNTPDDTIEAWLIGAVATLPIWDFNRRRGVIEVRQSEVEQTRINLHGLEAAIHNEIAASSAQIAFQREFLDLMDTTVAYMQDYRDLYEDRLNSGVAKRLDLISAEVDLAQAEYKKVEAMYQLLLAQLSLLYATGDITQLLELE